MNKKMKFIVTSLIVAGTLSTGTSTIAKAASNTCSASVNQQILLKDILNKYPQLKKIKISTLKSIPQNETTNSTSQQNTDTPKPSDSTENNGQTTSKSTEASEVIRLVNVERTKNGLAPLKENSELSKVASVKAQDMIDKNYFDHNSPTYGSPFDMMKKFGINYSAAGENIAYGQKTPEEVMTAWMNSPGHRSNILNSNFTEIGVGVAKDKNGTPYWVQMFINPGK